MGYLKDVNVLEKFIFPSGSTHISDDRVFISGLGADLGDESEAHGFEMGITGIKREWVWMSKSKAEDKVKELHPPETAVKLKLESKKITLGSLLFGSGGTSAGVAASRGKFHPL